MYPLSGFARYGCAVLLAGIAILARLALDPVLGTRIPYATLYLAVAVSAITGGTGPGVISTLLGGFAAAYFIVPPRQSLLVLGADHQLGFGLYLFVSAILILLADVQRRTTLRLRREVSQREAAEAEERFQRQRFETTLSSIGDGVIATDYEGRITFINRVASDLTGWPQPDALGQPVETVFDIRSEETGRTVENPALRAMREGRVTGLANHTLLLSKDGRRIPIDDSGAPILGRAGKPVGAVLVFRDVSEAKAHEAELRKRQRMIDLCHDAIILTDPERRVTGWNTGARELYGWEAEEARGQVIHELLRTRDSKVLAEIEASLRDKERWDGELVHCCKEGREVICESRLLLLRDHAGEVAGILEINRDITARKRAEADLRRAVAEAEGGRRTLEALLEHIPEGIAIADAPDIRIRNVSRYGARLVGKPVEALLDTAAFEHPEAWAAYHPDGETPARAEELPLTRAITHGEVSTDEEWMVRRPDGEKISILCNAGPIRDGEGRITGGLIAWRDITQRKRLEDKVREAAKLESLGVLAGGIAHDFNNLLTGIMGNASLLLEEVPEGGNGWSFANAIVEASERAAKLTQQMLAYSGRGRFMVEPVDLSAYIRQTAALIRSSIPKNVELRFDLAEDLPAVEADSAQLQQLVMNLVINGAEATGDSGGHVIVATRSQEVDETYLRTLLLEENVQPGRYVVLEVTDSGCGMDEQTMGKIFDPFFTTKFAGRGLGLAAVQGIVRGHKGAMKVYSAPGRGTTFRVLLPAGAVAAQPEREEPAVAARAAGAAETVLVVDDEAIVLATAKRALERLGYTVVEATHGAEAVELLRSAGNAISLVLLDMTMPGMSGEETLREMRKLVPGVRIILSSGYSETEALRRFEGYGLAGFLQKPYTVTALAQKVTTASAADA